MTDLSLWQTAPLDAAIEHILQRYHETHRNQLAELGALAQKVAGVHADSFPAALLPLLQGIEAELLSHMMKEEQVLFQIGRRTGVFRQLADLAHPSLRAQAQRFVAQWMVDAANIDQVCDQLMQRFI